MTSLCRAGYIAAILCTLQIVALADDARPNVLFIAIDDQNDWIGALHGHPLVQTPNIDRLTARGEIFLNAHCQAPLCNPSRTSLMLGLRPTTTGVYGLAPWFRTLNKWKDRVSLPQHFAAHGYHTYAAGKVYHPFDDENQLAAEFATRGPLGGVGAKPSHKLIPPTPQNNPLMDWGT